MTDNDIVKWRAFYGDPQECEPIIDWQETRLGDWIDCESNAEAAVNDCLDDYFRIAREWTERFGEDTGGDLLVTVMMPASIAGEYRVRLTRIVKASATRIEI